MKRIAFLITFVFLGLGATVWVAQSFVANWEPLLRTQLEERVGQTLHCRVHIENISVSFIHRIALRDVEIWDTEPTPNTLLFRANEVSLTISLLDLPWALLHRNPLESIGLISIDTPVLKLSQEFLQRQKVRHTSSSKPLWFTIEWNAGTFQWKDAQAPHGAWTLYQSRGIYRIRGPHMNATVDGGLEQVEAVNMHFTSLGHRWSAQAHLEKGDISAVMALVQRLQKRFLSPETWKAEGRFHLDLKASGKWPLARTSEFVHLIQEAHLTFFNAQLNTGASAPPLHLNGGVVLKGSRIDFTTFTLSIEKSVFKITGQVWPFSQEPQLDIHATGPQTNLEELSHVATTFFPALPAMKGLGDIHINLKGEISHPSLLLEAKIPQGEVGRWSFRDASIFIQRVRDQWIVSPSTLKLWQGTLTLKGTSSQDQTDLQLTGNDLSLQESAVTPSSAPLRGNLNFSVALHGPMNDLHTVGSYWINNLSWGHNHTDSLRGNLDIAPNRFALQGASEDNTFYLDAEGTRTSKLVTLDQLQFQAPSGVHVTAQGSWSDPNQRLHLLLNAENIAIPDDLPITSIHLPVMKGTADVHGRLDGPVSDLVFKADVISHRLQVGERTISSANASVRWTSNTLEIDPFHVDPGIDGSLHYWPGPSPEWDLKLNLTNAPADILMSWGLSNNWGGGVVTGTLALKDQHGMSGHGDLTLTNGTLGQVTLTQGRLGFILKDHHLDLQRLSVLTPQGKAEFTGQAKWEATPAATALSRIFIHAQGRIASLNDGSLWSIPCKLHGWVDPTGAWHGEFNLETSAIKVRGESEDPFSFHLTWNSKDWVWDQIRWGNTLSGFGALRHTNDRTQWSGQLKTHNAQIAHLQSWLWPKLKEPLYGLLSGTLTLNGNSESPQIDFSGKIHDGHWRTLAFDNEISGIWKKEGLDPLVLNGSLQKGGQFQFRGRVSSLDQSASGSLDLSQVNLESIGQSLAFPHPLTGKANGTFTLNGPLDQLHVAGHIEGTAISYGKPDGKPLLLQSVVMDMKLDPVENQPSITRLTVIQAFAKTLEEEIRLNPGSTIEFAGTNAARMRIGTEIRNLHLSVFTLFGGMDISGTWQIKPEGFDLEGDIYTRSLFINDYQLEQGHINASYYNRILTFKPPRSGASLVVGTIDFQNAPQLKFKDFAIAGKDREGLRLAGDIGPRLWNFAMDGRGIDIGTLSGLAGFPYPLQGTADVKIHGSGDLDHPHVEGALNVQDGQVIGLKFKTGSAAFIWQDQHMTFTHLTLGDPGRYTLTGTGTFPLVAKENHGPRDKSIDFSIRLVDSNLGLLESITPEVKEAKGSVQALLQIKGTSDTPSLRGSIRVRNGDVVGAHYFRHLRDFQVAADFDSNDMVISEFRGKSQKGEFVGGGHISLSGFEPKYYDLHLDIPSSKGIEVTVPELAIPESPLAKKLHFLTTASQCDVKGKATFKGPAESPVLFSEAYLSNGHFTFPPSTKNPPPPGFMEWIRRITWDTNLHFSDNAWFENELVEANLIGDLRIKGPSDRLKVDGNIDIGEGKISYLGIDFDIRQAHYDLRSRDTGSTIETTPYVRGTAESNVQTVDPVTGQGINDTITLQIDYAPVTEIKPRLVSNLDPTLPQDKLLARVTQLEVQNLTPQERNYMYQQQMVRLIDTSLATPLARNLLKRTGLVDELHVSRVINPAANTPVADPSNPTATTQQNAAADFLAGTKYTLAKNLSNRLSLGYGLRFEEIANPDQTNKLDLRSDVEMSYRFLSNIYLRGTFDLPTSTPGALPDRKVTIEPRWRFGWWGNTNKTKPKPDKTPPKNTPPQNN